LPKAALAEALFSLSETEPDGERRLEILKLAYAVFDAGDAGDRIPPRSPWLESLYQQLRACRGEDALGAAVERLGGGRAPRRHSFRDRFFSRQEVELILQDGPPELLPERMRGAFHWHTRDSDGKADLEGMARACLRRGSRWAVVTDHSRALEVASGLDLEGVRIQGKRIRRWNEKMGEEMRLFQGLEVEILEDGSLDLPASERAELDCVALAVHRDFDPDKDQTERLLRAVDAPHVHVLAHPRARHFHQRHGLRIQWERLFRHCAERDVALEINGFPRRQDLDAGLASIAAELGCTFVLASDAHAVHHLNFDAFACAIAMRAGLDPRSILNTRQAEDFAAWLEVTA